MFLVWISVTKKERASGQSFLLFLIFYYYCNLNAIFKNYYNTPPGIIWRFLAKC